MLEKQRSTPALNNDRRLPTSAEAESAAQIAEMEQHQQRGGGGNLLIPAASAWTMPRASGAGAANNYLSSAEEDSGEGLGPGIGGLAGTEIRRNRMEKLMSTVNELNRAMESLVVSVISEDSKEAADAEEEEAAAEEDAEMNTQNGDAGEEMTRRRRSGQTNNHYANSAPPTNLLTNGHA